MVHTELNNWVNFNVYVYVVDMFATQHDNNSKPIEDSTCAHLLDVTHFCRNPHECKQTRVCV